MGYCVGPDSASAFRLTGLACYYGQHYMYIRWTGEAWALADDELVKIIGSWEDVRGNCVRGRCLQSLLIYQRA